MHEIGDFDVLRPPKDQMCSPTVTVPTQDEHQLNYFFGSPGDSAMR